MNATSIPTNSPSPAPPPRSSAASVSSDIAVLQTETQSYDRYALFLENIGKRYYKYARQRDRLRHWWRRFQPDEFWAVRNVQFAVERGQTVGILGANGSGKSTLLQLIAGTLTPTEGRLGVQGRVAALLELGSGFHPEFTGWENARLQAGILGLSPDEVEARLPTIAAFSELAAALDDPVRTYSSGMIVRLGFSVAISVDPDILLIDEALAVGDMRFQQKCMGRIRQLRERGVTIVLVTHDLSAIKRLCDEAHVLERGQLVQSGQSEPVSNWYFGKMMSQTGADPEPVPEAAGIFRHGEGGARVESWQVVDASKQPIRQAWLGQVCTLEVSVSYSVDIAQPVLGFFWRDRLGTEVLGTNTHAANVPLPPGRPGERVNVSFRFALRLRPGAYTLCVAIAENPQQSRCLDWVDNALVLELVDPVPGRTIHGLVAEEIDVRVHPEPLARSAAA